MKRLVLIVAWLVAVGGAGRKAEAADSAQLYDDLRNVIEDLVKSDVAQNVAKKLQGEHPALCFYFQGALSRMQSSYWAGVPGQLHEGLVAISGDFVVWYAGLDKPIKNPFDAFTTFVQERDKELKKVLDTTTKGYCTQREWANARTLLEDCDPKQPNCMLGRMTTALLDRQPSRAVAISKEFLIDNLSSTHATLLRLALSGTKDLSNYTKGLKELGGPYEFVKSGLVDCTQGLQMSAESPCWYLDLVQDIENATLELSVNDPAGGTPYKAALSISDVRHLVTGKLSTSLSNGASTSTLATLVGGVVTTPADCSSPGLKASLSVTIGAQSFPPISFCAGATGIVSKKPVAALETLHGVSLRWGTWRYIIKEQGQLLASLGFGVVNNSQSLHHAVTQLARLERHVDLLKGMFLPHENAKEPPGLRDILRLTASVLCEPGFLAQTTTQKRVCGGSGMESRLIAMEKDPVVRFIIRALDTRNYREMAVAALSTMSSAETQLAGADLKDARKRLTDAEKRFVVTFAAYIFDGSAQAGDTRLVAKEALRSVVQELLLETGRGFPTRDHRFMRIAPCNGSWPYVAACKTGHALFYYPAFTVWPALSVRWEFGDAWFDRTDDGMRRTVSLDALSVRVPVNNMVGVRASLLDVMSGVTELALRDPTLEPVDGELIWLDTFKPRVDLWIGFPKLTRRVAATAGMSVSFLKRHLEGESIRYDYDVTEPQYSVNLGFSLFL